MAQPARLHDRRCTPARPTMNRLLVDLTERLGHGIRHPVLRAWSEHLVQNSGERASYEGGHDEQPHLVQGIAPWNTAGPSARAGFTDVPDKGTPTKWTAVREMPMATPATAGEVAIRPVTASTT